MSTKKRTPKPDGRWFNSVDDETAHHMLESVIVHAHDELGIDAVEFYELMRVDAYERDDVASLFKREHQHKVKEALKGPRLGRDATSALVLIALLVQEHRRQDVYRRAAAFASTFAIQPMGDRLEMPVVSRKTPGVGPRDDAFERLVSDATK